MSKYRCYLLEKTGRYADTKVFTAPEDKDAASYAFALFVQASSHYDRFEVWRQDTLVHAFSRDAMQIGAGRNVRGQVWNPQDVANSGPLMSGSGDRSQPVATTSAFKPLTGPRVWAAAVRGVAVAFALTLSWILLFDSGFLKSMSVASARSPSEKHLSQFP
jgi:hypothetical protein